MKSPSTIYHAFNETFSHTCSKLKYLRHTYDGILIGPCQKSTNGTSKDWWRQYQPISYDHIGGLGTEDELADLCARARSHKVKVIAEVVFHQMAPVATRSQWLRASRDSSYRETLLNKLNNRFRPSFNKDDFHLFSQKRNANYSLCPNGDPSVPKATDKVLRKHCEHLKLLLDLGVQGFRISSSDLHTPFEVKRYVDYARQIYPEVIIFLDIVAFDKGKHAAYRHIAPSVDFPLARCIRDAFVTDDLTSLKKQVVLGNSDMRFVRDRLSVYDTVSGFGVKYKDHELSLLAWCYLLANKSGSVVVYPDVALHRSVLAAGAFRKQMSYSAEPVTMLVPSDFSDEIATNLIVIVCGRYGFAVINVANDHFHSNEARFGAECGLSGRYVELRHKIAVEVNAEGTVVQWGDQYDVGLHVGPMSALFFCRTRSKRGT